MSDYIISVCSTADLDRESMERYGLKYAMFTYTIDGVDYKDDMFESVTPEFFYSKIMSGAKASTSQVSTAGYIDLWEPFLKEGKDILHLCLDSGISGTYNSALVAKDMVGEKYPDRKIVVIDTLCATCSFALLAVVARKNQDEGMTIEENAEFIEKNKLRFHTWFFISDLTCLIRGGRVSKVAGGIGKVLNICPVLYVAKDGSLQTYTKVRGRKACRKVLLERMQELAEGGRDYSGKCFMTHSLSYDDARAVADMIEETFPKLDGKVEIGNIGTVIGTHTGTGCVVISFYGKEREQ